MWLMNATPPHLPHVTDDVKVLHNGPVLEEQVAAATGGCSAKVVEDCFALPVQNHNKQNERPKKKVRPKGIIETQASSTRK